MREDFGALILTHGRADNVETVEALKKRGYTGKYYIVIDNEDEQEAEYIRLYGDKVVKFDKLEQSKKFDTMDLSDNRKTIVYARNASFEIAKQLGLTYFIELDDDYDTFSYRIERNGELLQRPIKQLDAVWEAMIDFLDTSGAITVAMAQGGDFIGGVGSRVWKQQICRKAMNSFICRTDTPFQFIGRINEDVNTYVTKSALGEMMFTIAQVMLNQETTQKNGGGMTDVYMDAGTYIKSFYTIIAAPSAARISIMGNTDKRIHHKIEWKYCETKIVSSKYRKKSNDEQM